MYGELRDIQNHYHLSSTVVLSPMTLQLSGMSLDEGNSSDYYSNAPIRINNKSKPYGASIRFGNKTSRN